LNIYDSLIEPLMAGDRTESIIRHPGLNLHHIYVCPSTKKIIGIYDWQETEAQPMVLQEDFLTLANNRGHTPKSPFNYPEEPDYDEVPAQHKRSARATFVAARAYHLYFTAVALYNPIHFSLISHLYPRLKGGLVEYAATPWDGTQGNVIGLQASILKIAEEWNSMVGGPCPIQFENGEQERWKKEVDEWRELLNLFTYLREYLLGIESDGEVPHELYEEAKKENERFRRELIFMCEPEERRKAWQDWPYKDDSDESEWDEEWAKDCTGVLVEGYPG
jgi:hypothetical protein